MKQTSRFTKGTGVYECGSCHRKTRETDPDAAGVRLCAQRYEIGGLENAIADGCAEPGDKERLEALRKEVAAKAA